jgi:hypothetical protein
MKKTRNLIDSLLVCGVALAMVSTLSARTTGEQGARVVRIQGAARCQVAGGTWQDLQLGSVIKAGSVIQSGIDGGSYVDVALGGGVYPSQVFGALEYRNIFSRYTVQTKPTVIHLYANTVLGVDKLAATETGAGTVTETELDLRKGHILGIVKKPTAGSDFKIRCPRGVASVRSGIFDMTAEEFKEVKPGETPPGEQVHVTFAMATGSGSFAPGAAVAQDVPAGQSFDSGAISADNPTGVSPMPPDQTGTLTAAGEGLAAPVEAAWRGAGGGDFNGAGVGAGVGGGIGIIYVLPPISPTTGTTATTGND